MAIVDLYSKRAKRERGEVVDVYQYDRRVFQSMTSMVGQLHYKTGG